MTSPGLATFPPSRRRSPARNLDWPALAQQLEWYVQERMHGVILAGTSGEWFSLNEAERAQLFAESGRNIGGRITVLGGCNAYRRGGHPPCARRATRGAGRHHPHPAPYIVPSHRELVQFYQDVSDATDIPICVYNWPRGCVVDMDVELLEELSDIDHVVAIKNSTPDFGMFLQGAYRLRHGSATSTCPPRRWAPIWRRWASATA